MPKLPRLLRRWSNALLHDETVQSGIDELRSLKIVRLHDGAFSVARNCFFANDHTGEDVSR